LRANSNVINVRKPASNNYIVVGDFEIEFGLYARRVLQFDSRATGR
jgi:hypothetical protein